MYYSHHFNKTFYYIVLIFEEVFTILSLYLEITNMQIEHACTEKQKLNPTCASQLHRKNRKLQIRCI